MEIPSDFPDEGSPSIVDSMGFYEDTYEGHDQTGCGVDSSPDVQPRLTEVYDEQPINPMRDIQGDESPTMI